jgi:hypothetical protein
MNGDEPTRNAIEHDEMTHGEITQCRITPQSARASRRRFSLALPLVFALCVLPNAAQSQRQERDPSRWSTPRFGSGAATERGYQWYLAEHLSRNGGPREFALAAHVRAMAGVHDVRIVGDLRAVDVDTQRWLGDAERMGKRDPVVQVLLLHRFSAADPTNRQRDALRRWRDQDYSNLAPLLVSGSAEDALSIDEILGGARSALEMDSYFDDIVRPLIQAVREEPPPASLLSDPSQTPEAFGTQLGMTIWAASANIVFNRVVNACRGQALSATPQRRADCRHVAKLLSDESDTLIARAFGVRMRLNSGASEAELLPAMLAYRRHHWQMQQWNALERRDPVQSARDFARILADDADITEIQIVERMLVDAGIALAPPANWSAP